MKKILLVFLLLVAVNTNGWSADPNGALQLAQTTTDRMLDALRQNRAQLDQNTGIIYDLVDGIVLPHFDFKTIARWVLGKHWRQANDAQREQFTVEFQTLMVRIYAKTLLEYTSETIHYLPMQAATDADDVTVRSEVRPQGSPAIPINYSMHAKQGTWKVYDVIIDGVSLVSNYRNSLGGQISKEGLDSVIAKLSQRNGKS